METRVFDHLSLSLVVAVAVLGASASQAAGHHGRGHGQGHERGERITFTPGTAPLSVGLENFVSGVPSFSVDAFTSRGDERDDVRGLGDEVSRLGITGISRRQAIRNIRAVRQSTDGGERVSHNGRSHGKNNGGTAEIHRDRDQFEGGPRPIPEPSAALIFGIGALVTGTALRRRA